ncbi:MULTISPECIES: dihydroneopterin aldolase [Rhizobium/Agrobacterium group]|jgi:dihydroneopterin aldolase|uniref:dihydroneopterin aldolase n=1 Tax=Rhizobium/Agrobacterium group TaxID=227290 RepID=UPI00071342FD|nr:MULTISPECIES: dihydroneopterin aldolase [Rhizobium/Agrobacterium group]KQQ46825.1 dienelactone hydrolase [Rhizobium sp. Leaf311]
MSLYTILLKNCSFFARHGLLAQEETLGQRFFVDAEMEVEAGNALETDDISNTVDYGVAFDVIEKIVAGQRRYLIEALANDIATALRHRYPQIVRVKITVRKPSAPVPGILDYAQVSVEQRG